MINIFIGCFLIVVGLSINAYYIGCLNEKIRGLENLNQMKDDRIEELVNREESVRT